MLASLKLYAFDTARRPYEYYLHQFVRHSQSCSTSTDCPGAMVVKACFEAATSGIYFALIPEKEGRAPSAEVISKVSAGKVERGERGSLSSLTVSSPVFVTVAVTLRSSVEVIESEPEYDCESDNYVLSRNIHTCDFQRNAGCRIN
jgi:hypothetical protein